jgi:hypothetical protein
MTGITIAACAGLFRISTVIPSDQLFTLFPKALSFVACQIQIGNNTATATWIFLSLACLLAFCFRLQI